MSQQLDLLQKLYSFYSRRYNGSTLEEKFNAAVYDLVKTHDIEKSTYMEFCVDNNIEPYVEPAAPVRPAPVAPQPQARYYEDPCSRGYTISGC